MIPPNTYQCLVLKAFLEVVSAAVRFQVREMIALLNVGGPHALGRKPSGEKWRFP